MNKIALQLEAKLFKGFADQSRLAILETILKEPKNRFPDRERNKTVSAKYFNPFGLFNGVRFGC